MKIKPPTSSPSDNEKFLRQLVGPADQATFTNLPASCRYGAEHQYQLCMGHKNPKQLGLWTVICCHRVGAKCATRYATQPPDFEDIRERNSRALDQFRGIHGPIDTLGKTIKKITKALEVLQRDGCFLNADAASKIDKKLTAAKSSLSPLDPSLCYPAGEGVSLAAKGKGKAKPLPPTVKSLGKAAGKQKEVVVSDDEEEEDYLPVTPKAKAKFAPPANVSNDDSADAEPEIDLLSPPSTSDEGDELSIIMHAIVYAAPGKPRQFYLYVPTPSSFKFTEYQPQLAASYPAAAGATWEFYSSYSELYKAVPEKMNLKGRGKYLIFRSKDLPGGSYDGLHGWEGKVWLAAKAAAGSTPSASRVNAVASGSGHKRKGDELSSEENERQSKRRA
ncbi:hypothetical protein B0H11DRAFT_2230019 [Mycena galericulata]|nr:hypothetical protein B0H11DRAFT_2230019 [Mycena galericulata]